MFRSFDDGYDPTAPIALRKGASEALLSNPSPYPHLPPVDETILSMVVKQCAAFAEAGITSYKPRKAVSAVDCPMRSQQAKDIANAIRFLVSDDGYTFTKISRRGERQTRRLRVDKSLLRIAYQPTAKVSYSGRIGRNFVFLDTLWSIRRADYLAVEREWLPACDCGYEAAKRMQDKEALARSHEGMAPVVVKIADPPPAAAAARAVAGGGRAFNVSSSSSSSFADDSGDDDEGSSGRTRHDKKRKRRQTRLQRHLAEEKRDCERANSVSMPIVVGPSQILNIKYVSECLSDDENDGSGNAENADLPPLHAEMTGGVSITIEGEGDARPSTAAVSPRGATNNKASTINETDTSSQHRLRVVERNRQHHAPTCPSYHACVDHPIIGVIATMDVQWRLFFEDAREADTVLLAVSYLRYMALERMQGSRLVRDLWLLVEDSHVGSVLKSNVYDFLEEEFGTRPAGWMRKQIEDSFAVDETVATRQRLEGREHSRVRFAGDSGESSASSSDDDLDDDDDEDEFASREERRKQKEFDNAAAENERYLRIDTGLRDPTNHDLNIYDLKIDTSTSPDGSTARARLWEERRRYSLNGFVNIFGRYQKSGRAQLNQRGFGDLVLRLMLNRELAMLFHTIDDRENERNKKDASAGGGANSGGGGGVRRNRSPVAGAGGNSNSSSNTTYIHAHQQRTQSHPTRVAWERAAYAGALDDGADTANMRDVITQSIRLCDFKKFLGENQRRRAFVSRVKSSAYVPYGRRIYTEPSDGVTKLLSTLLNHPSFWNEGGVEAMVAQIQARKAAQQYYSRLAKERWQRQLSDMLERERRRREEEEAEAEEERDSSRRRKGSDMENAENDKLPLGRGKRASFGDDYDDATTDDGKPLTGLPTSRKGSNLSSAFATNRSSNYGGGTNANASGPLAINLKNLLLMSDAMMLSNINHAAVAVSSTENNNNASNSTNADDADASYATPLNRIFARHIVPSSISAAPYNNNPHRRGPSMISFPDMHSTINAGGGGSASSQLGTARQMTVRIGGAESNGLYEAIARYHNNNTPASALNGDRGGPSHRRTETYESSYTNNTSNHSKTRRLDSRQRAAVTVETQAVAASELLLRFEKEIMIAFPSFWAMMMDTTVNSWADMDLEVPTTYPIMDYYINSSHNTQETGGGSFAFVDGVKTTDADADTLGRGTNNGCDPEGFARALHGGVRMVQMTVRDGPNGIPILANSFGNDGLVDPKSAGASDGLFSLGGCFGVSRGNNGEPLPPAPSDTFVKAQTALIAIRDTAFTTTDLPVILDIEVFIYSESQRNTFAKLLKDVLGDALVGDGAWDLKTTSLSDYRNKILIKRKIRPQMLCHSDVELKARTALVGGGSSLYYESRGSIAYALSANANLANLEDRKPLVPTGIFGRFWNYFAPSDVDKVVAMGIDLQRYLQPWEGTLLNTLVNFDDDAGPYERRAAAAASNALLLNHNGNRGGSKHTSAANSPQTSSLSPPLSNLSMAGGASTRSYGGGGGFGGDNRAVQSFLQARSVAEGILILAGDAYFKAGGDYTLLHDARRYGESRAGPRGSSSPTTTTNKNRLLMGGGQSSSASSFASASSSSVFSPTSPPAPLRHLQQPVITTPLQYRIAYSSKLTCVYPSLARSVNKSNMDPLRVWSLGAHCAAMNFQTWDMGLHINTALFAAYGSKGYVLKPRHLRREGAMALAAAAASNASSGGGGGTVASSSTAMPAGTATSPIAPAPREDTATDKTVASAPPASSRFRVVSTATNTVVTALSQASPLSPSPSLTVVPSSPPRLDADSRARFGIVPNVSPAIRKVLRLQAICGQRFPLPPDTFSTPSEVIFKRNARPALRVSIHDGTHPLRYEEDCKPKSRQMFGFLACDISNQANRSQWASMDGDVAEQVVVNLFDRLVEGHGKLQLLVDKISKEREMLRKVQEAYLEAIGVTDASNNNDRGGGGSGGGGGDHRGSASAQLTADALKSFAKLQTLHDAGVDSSSKKKGTTSTIMGVAGDHFGGGGGGGRLERTDSDASQVSSVTSIGGGSKYLPVYRPLDDAKSFAIDLRWRKAEERLANEKLDKLRAREEKLRYDLRGLAEMLKDLGLIVTRSERYNRVDLSIDGRIYRPSSSSSSGSHGYGRGGGVVSDVIREASPESAAGNNGSVGAAASAAAKAPRRSAAAVAGRRESVVSATTDVSDDATNDYDDDGFQTARSHFDDTLNTDTTTADNFLGGSALMGGGGHRNPRPWGMFVLPPSSDAPSTSRVHHRRGESTFTTNTFASPRMTARSANPSSTLGKGGSLNTTGGGGGGAGAAAAAVPPIRGTPFSMNDADDPNYEGDIVTARGTRRDKLPTTARTARSTARSTAAAALPTTVVVPPIPTGILAIGGKYATGTTTATTTTAASSSAPTAATTPNATVTITTTNTSSTTGASSSSAPITPAAPTEEREGATQQNAPPDSATTNSKKVLLSNKAMAVRQYLIERARHIAYDHCRNNLHYDNGAAPSNFMTPFFGGSSVCHLTTERLEEAFIVIEIISLPKDNAGIAKKKQTQRNVNGKSTASPRGVGNANSTATTDGEGQHIPSTTASRGDTAAVEMSPRFNGTVYAADPRASRHVDMVPRALPVITSPTTEEEGVGSYPAPPPPLGDVFDSSDEEDEEGRDDNNDDDDEDALLGTTIRRVDIDDVMAETSDRERRRQLRRSARLYRRVAEAKALAVACVPLVALRGGYRAVPFRDADAGHLLEKTSLLCHFEEVVGAATD